MTDPLPRAEVAPLCERLRIAGHKIVFTNGCFDVLHWGHIQYLTQAKALGSFLFVGLNSDSSVKGLKGPERPVQSELDRARILLALKAVDGVSIFSEDNPLELIKLVKPGFLVKGGDWAPEKIVGKDFVEGLGGKVISLPFVDGHSSSQILERIKKL